MASEDVTALLDRCYCLNESRPQQFMHLFAGDHALALQSDTDEQLLLHLAFRQTISLKQMQIGVPNNTNCPKKVKLFRNLLHPDFSHAAGTPPCCAAELTPLTHSRDSSHADHDARAVSCCHHHRTACYQMDAHRFRSACPTMPVMCSDRIMQ